LPRQPKTRLAVALVELIAEHLHRSRAAPDQA
jgi:hypothetical protein